jgi:cellulase/cellobiase CelA1
MTRRNWLFPHTSHAIADLFRRRKTSRPRGGRPTLASLAGETLEPRSMMAVTPPSISIDDITITEGDTGKTNAAITLRLSQPASSVVSLRFATANGTATAGSDFVAKTGSVSFAAGTTTKQVLIAIKGDRTYEPNETFSINLSSPKRATIADRSGTVTIANNDPSPTPAAVPAATPSPAVTLPAPAVVAAPTPTVAATSSSAVAFSVTSDWGSGFNGDVTVRNTTSAAYANWTVEFDFDGQISSLWNGVIASRSGSHYTVRNESWNGSLVAGSSTAFGFTANPGGTSAVLRNLTLVGSATASPTPTPTPTPTPMPMPMPMPTPTPTPTPIEGTTGRVFLVNPAAGDIVGFDPSRDRLDFADVSVHNLIVAKTETGEVAIVNPWASTPEFQVLRGINYRDLTMANFGVVQNEHLRQDIGGVVSWEQGIGPRDGSTVYVRSHEYGVQQRIEGFNPATRKLSFLYFGTRERLSVRDTAEGLLISVLPTNQSILLVGVTKAQLMTENVEFHHDQIVEDQLEVPFGHPAEHFTLVSRASLLTPTAPIGQVTDGYQTSIGVIMPGGMDHGTMPMPTPMPTPAPTGKVVTTYTQTSAWGTGFNGDMKIKNTGTTAINGWTMEFDMKANIVNIWNAVIVSHVGNHYVIKNADWNGTIAAGAEISFGFQADGVAGELPSTMKVNGTTTSN